MIKVSILLDNNLTNQSKLADCVICYEHICGFYPSDSGTSVILSNSDEIVIRESIDELSYLIMNAKAFIFTLN